MTQTTTTPAAHDASNDTSRDEQYRADCGHLTTRSATVPCGAFDSTFECEACAEKHIAGCARCLAA